MKAKNYNALDVSSASRRLSELIKENGGVDEAIKNICPLDYTILRELVKRYKEVYPSMSPEYCTETDSYLHPAKYLCHSF